jgi:hypothetical protein
MSQRIADASAKVAPSFYPLPRMTDSVLFGLSRKNEAKKIQDKVLALDCIPGAFISRP